MFDKLEALLIRYEEIMGELHEPDVANNQTRYRALMKEQSDLTAIVEAYTEYKKCNTDIEDSLSMLEEESDERRQAVEDAADDLQGFLLMIPNFTEQADRLARMGRSLNAIISRAMKDV